MTTETTAAQGTPNSDTSAQSTAAAATTTAATTAADTAATATQQKPAESTTTKAADATATTPAKDGDKPADKPEGDTKKADDAAKAATDKAAKDAADAEAAKAAKTAPEKYEPFTLPDGVKIAPEVEAQVTATAKEFGLPQEGAQKLVNAAIDLQKSFATQMDAKITAIRAEWETNSRTDKEFGGDNFEVNLAVANTAVRAFGSPAFKQLLKDSGVGSHPEFIRTFLNIGKSISQDTLVTGGDGVPSEAASGFATAASKLYGGTK